MQRKIKGLTRDLFNLNTEIEILSGGIIMLENKEKISTQEKKRHEKWLKIIGRLAVKKYAIKNKIEKLKKEISC